MTAKSTVPAFKAAAAARLAAALPGVVVANGPVVVSGADAAAVSVGWQDDQPGVQGQYTSDTAVALPDRETYTVNCTLQVRDGDGDPAAAETRAFDLLDAARAAFAADQTFADLVMRAHVGEWTAESWQDNTGANVRVLFGVDVDAYTTQ
jgi:hypothetical protein